MNLKYFILTFFTFCILFSSCKSVEKGHHLFILSGQSNMMRLDPKTSFTPTLEAKFGKENIIIVKDAKGTQPISEWYKNWQSPSGEIPKERGKLYDRLLLKVNDSIQNKNIKSVTFIWMQGERDARMAFAEVYEESLMGMYYQLQKDLNKDDINFVIGRLSDFDMQNKNWTHWTKIREIQMKVGDSKPNFSWINTDDLNTGLNANGKMVTNDLHLSEEGYKMLGKRFAEKSIQLIEKK